jgi:hypothetical protein
MAFIKKQPINKLKPFNTTGAALEDHTNYVNPKVKIKKASKSNKK